ncbi:MAG: CBS domain-containing protein [Gammaproteobacteria bacterium]|nr:CBS domain-containing protein [Gammaproteobacteria bacterium]
MTDEPDTADPQRADYQRALDSMDTFIDVGVDDLMTLARRAEHFAAQRRIERLWVTEIMSTPLLKVGPAASMAEAAHLMVSRRISGLPVVNEDEALVGIITEADFLRALGVPAHDPTFTLWQTLESLLGHLSRHNTLHGPDDPVSQHMQVNVISVTTDDDIFEALAQMKAHKVKRLVVCDAQGQAVGMVTRSDLVKLFFDRFNAPHDASR